jgi:hypothetical protein
MPQGEDEDRRSDEENAADDDPHPGRDIAWLRCRPA